MVINIPTSCTKTKSQAPSIGTLNEASEEGQKDHEVVALQLEAANFLVQEMIENLDPLVQGFFQFHHQKFYTDLFHQIVSWIIPHQLEHQAMTLSKPSKQTAETRL